MSMSTFHQLQTAFPDLNWESNVRLEPFTYMKIGGPAEVLWQARNLDELREVVQFVRQQDIELTVLGGASNVVIDDAGLSGLVIINRCEGLLVEDGALIAESGVKTGMLVRYSVDQGFAGLEPFLGVPGTLGGAIFNNAHYTNELIGNFVDSVEVVDLSGESKWLTQAECGFSYDHSRFHASGEIILQVRFRLQRGDATISQELIKETTVKRATTQPLGTANSGCMFQNVQLSPEEQLRFGGKATLPAGWLIDQAGLKGARVGNVVVSDKHANFMINTGDATSHDVQALVKKIQTEVQKTFGLKLEPEVFFLGTTEQKG